MFEPLLADIPWDKLAIFIIFVLGPLIGQLFKGRKAGPKVAPPRQRPPQAGPQPPRKALDQEIAEFLRQAQQNANRPAERQQNAPADVQRPPARPLVGPQQPQRPGRAEMPGKGPRSQPQPARQPGRPAASPAKPAPRRARGQRLPDQVGQHVSQHLDTSSLSQHSEDLGGRVRSADEQVEQHLHDVFDHQLGELDAELDKIAIRGGTDDASWQNLAEKKRQSDQNRALQIHDIVRMLRDPSAIREAIILSEVLKPPVSERS